MIPSIMAVVANRQITVSRSNEGPIVNIAAVRVPTSLSYLFPNLGLFGTLVDSRCTPQRVLLLFFYTRSENNADAPYVVAGNGDYGFIRWHSDRLEVIRSSKMVWG